MTDDKMNRCIYESLYLL